MDTRNIMLLCCFALNWSIWIVAVVSRMVKSIQCMPKVCAEWAIETPREKCFHKTCLFGKMCMIVNWNAHFCLLRTDRRNTKADKERQIGTFFEPYLVYSFWTLPFSKLYCEHLKSALKCIRNFKENGSLKREGNVVLRSVYQGKGNMFYTLSVSVKLWYC